MPPSTLLVEGAHSIWEAYFLLSGDQERRSVLLALAVSQVSLVQDNQYAKMAYFGAACPEFSPLNTCFLSGHLQKLLISHFQVLSYFLTRFIGEEFGNSCVHIPVQPITQELHDLREVSLFVRWNKSSSTNLRDCLRNK